MKYIKSFESIKEHELKKFVVYQSISQSSDKNITHYLLYIFEILNIDKSNKADERVLVKRYYEYNTILKKLIKNIKPEIKGSLKYLLDNTLFTSDNLQDCLDILPILKNTNKYNI